MYGYIYETINLINGKKYIGKHKSNKFDEKYLGSGVGLNLAILKYGKENFKVKIIEKINTNQNDLDLKEMYWIKYFDAVKNKEYYNRSYGGENEGWTGVNKAFKENGFPKEMRQKISIANKGKLLGRHLTEETKRKISKSRKGKLKGKENPFYGKHHTKKIKEKMSIVRKGKIPWNKGKTNIYSETTKKKMREKAIGRKHTAISKIKMSKSRMGHKVSEQTRQKMRLAISGRKYINKNGKNKMVKKEEIEKYLKQGWILGRKIVNNN